MEEEDLKFYVNLEELDKKINSIYPLILISVGLIGNTLTFFVYRSYYFKKTAIGLFYPILAVIDTLALCFGSIRFYLSANDYQIYSIVYCKFFYTSIYVFSQYSSWIHSIISIDQLISIKKQTISSQKFNTNKPIGVLLLVFVILVSLNIPNAIYLDWLTVNISNSNSSYELIKECDVPLEIGFYSRHTRDLIDLFFYFLIPFTLTASSGVFICFIIIKSKKRVASSTRGSLRKEYQFSVIVIGLNGLFLILNLPICVNLLIFNMKESEDVFLSSYKQKVIFNLFYTIACILMYINFSCGIFIHLALNHIFRLRFKKIFQINSTVNDKS